MNKKQIETLLHYVTIAIEQANQYKEIYESISEGNLWKYDTPLSNKEIDSLEIAHCDLELQLKAIDNEVKCNHENYERYQGNVDCIYICNDCSEEFCYM